jgi:HEAT repeat protein
MFRYRCPHCGQLLLSLEIRAGKTTVCSKCSRPLTIPADRSEWLNERGESLHGSATVVIPAGPPEVVEEPDNDVLGAIFVGSEGAREVVRHTDLHLEFLTPAGLPPAVAASPNPPPESAPPTDAGNPPPPPEPEPPPPPVVAEPRPVPEPTTPPRPAVPSRATVSAPEDEARRRRLVATRPAAPQRAPEPRTNGLAPVTPPPTQRESVSFDEPLRLRSQIDVAAELTAALTSRMKPPPRPPRDLRPSTAVWVLATILGIVLLVVTLVTNNDLVLAVAAFGLGQLLAGYCWVVWIAARRDMRRGLLAAIPVVTPWYLVQRKYANCRPLRFALSGAVLIVLAGVCALPATRGWLGTSRVTPAAPSENDLAGQPKHVRLKVYREQGPLPALLNLLEELAKTDQLLSEDASYRAEVASELRALCKHPDAGVRIRALEASVRWGADDARPLCLKFLESEHPEEREAALRLLPRWKDPDVARALALRVGRPDGNESTLAIKGLLEIGGPIAEQALIGRLEADDQNTRLLVIDLLANENLGGLAALKALRQLAVSPPLDSQAIKDPATRERAGRAAAIIAARQLGRLAADRNPRSVPDLIDLLDLLTRVSPSALGDDRYQAELAVQIKVLCGHPDPGVRAKALEAYARWGGDDARPLCLKFADAPNPEEREAALRLLPRWKDPDVARVLAAHVGRPGTSETTLAVNGLLMIGGPLAEDALIGRLEADDQATRLLVIDLLANENVGGPAALKVLRQLGQNPPKTSRAFDDPETRKRAAEQAAVIAARLKK